MTFASPSLATTDGGRRRAPRASARPIGGSCAARHCRRDDCSSFCRTANRSSAAATIPDRTRPIGASLALLCWRMLLDGEDGFADGYIDGDWSTPELGHLLEFCMQQRNRFDPRTEERLAQPERATGFCTGCAPTRGTAAGATSPPTTISATISSATGSTRHELFVGALCRRRNAGTRRSERSSIAPRHCLSLRGGERVLEIGCGWGALAERLIRRYGASVSGITLSTEQLPMRKRVLPAKSSEGTRRFALAGLSRRHRQFDRIASIEMIEAVGEHYWPAYFAKLRASSRQRRSGGAPGHHHRRGPLRRLPQAPDFIQRYIFPGGMLPTCSIIEREAARAGLKLRASRIVWRQLRANACANGAPDFCAHGRSIEPLGFNERFRRMWEYYLAYCEVGFRAGAIDVGFFKLAG